MDQQIGKVTHYFGKISVGVIELIDDELKVGDKIRIQGANTDFEQVVGSMQVDHQEVDSAKAGDAVGLKVDNPVHENDVVYKISEE